MATTTTIKKKPTTPKVDMSDVMFTHDEATLPDIKKTTAGTVRLDDSAVVRVRSNVFGGLYYIDPVTKEKFTWNACGEELPISMLALRHMRTGAAKFFVNQLVIPVGFDDENADKYEVGDIFKALNIAQYYKDILDPTNYEEICGWTPEVIQEKVPVMSSGTKGKLVVALNTYIEKGVLDSLKAIKTFEEVLGCDLMRPE